MSKEIPTAIKDYSKVCEEVQLRYLKLKRKEEELEEELIKTRRRRIGLEEKYEIVNILRRETNKEARRIVGIPTRNQKKNKKKREKKGIEEKSTKDKKKKQTDLQEKSDKYMKKLYKRMGWKEEEEGDMEDVQEED
jgi:Arc/MetJ family transcription regulator